MPHTEASAICSAIEHYRGQDERRKHADGQSGYKCGSIATRKADEPIRQVVTLGTSVSHWVKRLRAGRTIGARFLGEYWARTDSRVTAKGRILSIADDDHCCREQTESERECTRTRW